MINAYKKLFELGYAHSIEISENDEILGGLYGVSLGKVFYGESMFSKKPISLKLHCLNWQNYW